MTGVCLLAGALCTNRVHNQRETIIVVIKASRSADFAPRH